MIFNINFFLFAFAQSQIISYTFVYAKYYAHVTNAEFGVLAAILPAFALVAKPVACSVTDALGIHKKFLIASLSTFGLTYGSLGIIAYIKDPASTDGDFLAWCVIRVLMGLGYVSLACCYCMNDALASNYARKNNLVYSRMRLWSSIGWASGAILAMIIGDVEWLPVRVPGIIILSIAIAIDVAFLVLWPYEDDFEMFHDGSTVEQRKLSMVGPNTFAYLAQSQRRSSISRDLIERIKAGRSKSVGNLPRLGSDGGVPPLKKTMELNANSVQKVEPKKQKEYSNFQCQMILIKLIAMAHKSFLRYISLFVIFGFVNGIVLTYQFDFFKDDIAKGDPDKFNLMTNLSIIMQSVGEVPINLFASDLIKLFGSNACMSLALIAVGLRCFFYGHLLPLLGAPWVSIAEILQGPSYGFYWILIVDIGSNYALMVPDFMPEMKRRGIVRDRVHEEELNGCLRASMIGAMSSSQEGLGAAIGALAGGMLYSSLGYYFIWDLCAALAIITGFINIGWDVSTKLLFRKQKKIEKPNAPISIVVDDVDKTSKL